MAIAAPGRVLAVGWALLADADFTLARYAGVAPGRVSAILAQRAVELHRFSVE